MALRALVVGNSHIECAIAAAKRHPEAAEGFELLRFGRIDEPGVICAKTLLRRARDEGGTLRLFLSRVGALHNHISMFAPQEAYRFVGGGEIGDPADPLIPRRILSGWMEEEHFTKPFVRDLTAAYRDRFWLIAVPPPKQSNSYLHDRFGLKAKGAQYSGEIRQPRLSTAAQRLAIWQLEQKVIADWAAREGAGFLWPPEGTRNEDGFLKRRFYHDDLTHANADYGLEMLAQFQQRVAEGSGD